MPKVLNVKKLEEKFQTLSRSRESIQGLAMWIMHHKEVYVEIVEQWLIGVSNDCNTLAMFYVANEIIQGCGKKKCPEFREAFSKVLEEAVSFDHVKEFKDKILRLLSLWKERNLFENELYQSIEVKLQDIIEVESSDEESEDEELSELDIIQQFKKEILIDRVKNLKLLESKRQEKEDILNYADVPELPNLDNISVRKDCKEAIRKCDAYLKLAENYTKLMGKEISMRKRMLKELNKNCIFYTAQQKDVKEVANAFRVYGKRVKLLETKLGEKITTLSSPSYSPGFSDSSVSSNTGSFCEADDASKNYLSPFNKSNQSFLSSSSNDSFSFSGKVSSKLATEIFGGIKQPEKNVEESKISESVCSKEAQSIQKEKTQSPNVKEQANYDFSVDSGNPLEKEYANFLQCLQAKEEPESKPSPQEKVTFPEKISTKPVGKESYSPASEYLSEGILSESNSSLPIELENVPNKKGYSDSSQKKSKTQENEDIDLLLEESFDKKSNTKLHYKRKIELLLQSKAKKHCNEQQTREITNKELTKKVEPLLNLKEKQESKHVKRKEDIFNKSNNSKVSETSDVQSSNSTFKNVKNTENIINRKIDIVTKFKTSEIDIGSISSLIESVSDKTRVPDKSLAASTSSDSLSVDQIQTLPFDDTFTGIPMSTFVSNKPVSMSFEKEKQSENETLTFNPSATFTGMNMPSIMASLSTDACAKDTKLTDTKETFASDLFKKLPMTSFMPKISTEVNSEGLKQPEDFSRETPAIDLSSSIEVSPEDQQQEENESFPRVPAVPSFMFDMSTDFLKNILKINQQNIVTESNDEYNKETLGIAQQAESNSSDKEVFSLLSNSPHEESFTEDLGPPQVSKSNSTNLMQTLDSISPSEKVQTKAKDSLHNVSIKLKSSSSESVSKSVKLEEGSSIPNAQKTQDALFFKGRQNITSENLRCSKTEALEAQPSLLKTLQNVLECLTDNMQSKSDFEMSSIEKDSELEPPLPIEGLLKLYTYVHGCNDDYFSDNSVSPNIIPKNSNNNLHIPSFVNAENNYEVMDMECDSEGEIA